MTSSRRRDAFSRFYWVPVIVVGVTAWAVGLDTWVVLGIAAAVTAALFLLDWLYYRAGRGQDVADDRSAAGEARDASRETS